MAPPEILLERAEAVAIVTLNRPDRMNAVHLPMMIALADMLADLEGDETVGAIVLTGAGRGFCAGGDVKKIGRAHVCTPVTNEHLVCRLLLEKKKRTTTP